MVFIVMYHFDEYSVGAYVSGVFKNKDDAYEYARYLSEERLTDTEDVYVEEISFEESMNELKNKREEHEEKERDIHESNV